MASGARRLDGQSIPADRSRSHRIAERALSTAVGRITGRLAQSVVVVAAATTIGFLLLHAAPGDPYSTFDDGISMSAGAMAELRRRFGADEPLLQQYAMWLSNAIRGDLGASPSQGQPVSALLGNALPNTLLLMGLALPSSILFGVLLGAWQGVIAGTRSDRATSALTLVMYSVPEFVLGLGLLLLFATGLRWLPASGVTSDDYVYLSDIGRAVDRVRHLVLPWLALTIVGTGIFARYQRAAMRDSMDEPFVRTARAKGLPETEVRRHALRASLLPVITMAGLMFPALLGGAVLVEKVFNWPGMGMLTYNAITGRDYWLLSGALIVASAMTAAGTLLADIARTLADPRTAKA